MTTGNTTAAGTSQDSAIRAVFAQTSRAWADGDGEAFAAWYAPDATVILPGVYLPGQDAQSIEDNGGRAVVIHADHADPPAAARAVEQTVDHLRRLDILVNNAGIFTGGPLEQAAVQDLDRILAVNVKSVFLASQAAARHMSDGGRIITIGSALADRVSGPTLTLSSMAKSALSGLTKGLARDLGLAA